MTLHDADTRLAEPAEAEPLRPPTPGGFSIRPAMIVLGLGVLILAVFVTLGIVSSHSPAPVKTAGAPSAVPGHPAPGASRPADALPPIIGSGRASLEHHQRRHGAGRVRPDLAPEQRRGCRAVRRAGHAALHGLAGRAARPSTRPSMHQQGWQVFDKGAAANDPGALEVLGKLAGTDGYYWEMGATISPTTFGHGAPPSGDTDFTIRLLQQNDDQS